MNYKLKLKIINFLNLIAGHLNIHLDNSVSKNNISSLIELMKVRDLGHNLIRIGSDNDGGYLLPDILDEIEHCFSPGVGKIYEFEKEIGKKKINLFLADGTVDQKNIKIDKFDFINKNLSSKNDQNEITLQSWIEDKSVNNNKNLLLQMDIEGSEYEVISSTPTEYLELFKIMIIEFHFVEKIYNRLSYNIFLSSIKKILKSFEVSHIHPNNCQGYYNVCGEKFPTAIEITFLRKDLCLKNEKIKKLPHKLDQKNIKELSEVYMSEKWYN